MVEDNYLTFQAFTSGISFMVSFATPDIPLYSPSSRNSFGAIGVEERVSWAAARAYLTWASIRVVGVEGRVSQQCLDIHPFAPTRII